LDFSTTLTFAALKTDVSADDSRVASDSGCCHVTPRTFPRWVAISAIDETTKNKIEIPAS
jgi:hypothetical protein